MTHIYEFPTELGPHQINEMRPEVLGIHAKNPGVTNNSPSRSTMMSSHVSQHLIINGAEIPPIITGVEVEYSKYTTSDRVPFDARVVQIIDRYPSGISENSLKFNPEKFIVICDDETGLYDIISIPYHKSYHQYFGYKNEISEAVESLSPGSRLAKDTPLGDTPANIGDFYTHTTNLNCVLLSSDVVAEDSVLICDDIPDAKLQYRVYERRSVSVGVKKFPVSIAGKGKPYKPFYEIGEYVDEDGVVMWLRDYVEGLSPVTMSKSAVCEVNYTFDEAIYARQGQKGRVVDIRVIGNSDMISALPPEMAAPFEKYRQAHIRFCESLLECERKIFIEAYKKFGTKIPNFSGEFKSMLVEARAMTDKSREKTLQLLMNKNPIDEYLIEFVIEYVLRPTEGGKLTGRHGDKGVITKKIPRHRMPVDADGNSADVVMASDGTIARTNFGRPYDMQLGAVRLVVYKELKRITGLDNTCTLEEVQYLPKNVRLQAWELLMKVCDCINPDVVPLFEALSPSDKDLHIFETLESNVVSLRDIGCSRPWPHAVMMLENFIPVCLGPVTHQLIEDGKTETTIDSALIAPYPVMLLDKTAEDTLTVATAAHGPFGVLIKHNQADKYSKPWKDSPARTIGESEGRAYAAHTKDPEMIADMMDRANNPAVQLDMARMIVGSEHPGAIEEVVDRTKHDYGDTQPLGIAANFLQCYGIQMKYVPEDLHPEERGHDV